MLFAHTAELYPMQAVSGLSLTAFFPFIYREALMSAFFIASGYGFLARDIPSEPDAAQCVDFE